MLPDFPKLRLDLTRKLRSDFEKQTRLHAPLVAQIKVVAQHEGFGGTYETEDGQVKRIEPQHVSVPVGFPIISGPSFTYEDALNIVGDAAIKMAREQTKSLFAAVHQAVDEVGNAVDAEGNPITAELILKAWERMDFDFDKQGTPKMPTMVFNPIQAEKVKYEFERLHKEPQLAKRRQEIMNNKLADWYDRESRRKLVD